MRRRSSILRATFATGLMIWLVVGDAATQRDRLSALGLGAPRTVDRADFTR